MRADQHLRPWDRDGQNADRVPQLAVARELERIYADVLRDPLPPDLLRPPPQTGKRPVLRL